MNLQKKFAVYVLKFVITVQRNAAGITFSTVRIVQKLVEDALQHVGKWRHDLESLQQKRLETKRKLDG